MDISNISYYRLFGDEGILTKVAETEGLSLLHHITSRDVDALFSTYLLVMTPLLIGGWLIGSRCKMVPTPLQLAAEYIVGFVDEVCRDSMGDKIGRSFTPFIATTFLFIAFANYAGIWIPFGTSEPTSVINLPLSLGLLGFVVSLLVAFKYKGVFGYFRELIMEPIPIIMFPLNVIGELSKIVSISFRLFGNILGGAIIIAVVSDLVAYFVLPVGLVAFFGIFVGTIQAFVFMMLTLTYISMNIDVPEEQEEAAQ